MKKCEYELKDSLHYNWPVLCKKQNKTKKKPKTYSHKRHKEVRYCSSLKETKRIEVNAICDPRLGWLVVQLLSRF